MLRRSVKERIDLGCEILEHVFGIPFNGGHHQMWDEVEWWHKNPMGGDFSIKAWESPSKAYVVQLMHTPENGRMLCLFYVESHTLWDAAIRFKRELPTLQKQMHEYLNSIHLNMEGD